jgi:flagellin-like hook-associated protein FlgL
MTGIVLSASVRQNLLSLQSTSQLLATTQNDLATGNKVNSALDNPTNYFTASALNSRASDISSLLDSVGNGVQVLQAANTGITSLKSLLDSAKSIANQALQASSGYTQKSQFSATITGATANNLLGTPDTPATVTGTEVQNAGSDIDGSTTLSDLGFADGNSFSINGKTVTIATGGTGAAAATSTDADGNITVNLSWGSTPTDTTVSDLLSALGTSLGTGATASVASGAITLTNATADTTGNLVLADGSGGLLAKLGLTAGTTAATNSAMQGKTLTIGSTAGGTATDITFGTGAGQISTLNDLNSALAANNLMATIDTNGNLTISTTNNNASATIGDVGGTSTDTGGIFVSSAGAQTAPVADASSQETRSGLVSQYNTIMQQIKTTAQDSSFNGVNLLNGDLLQLTFNETGSSVLNIQGNTDDPAGLGLNDLTAGTDFLDNAGTNKIIAAINNASNVLDSQASTLGSNLSIVQIRQQFSTSMINVLQTGASNLTLADPNELAADSQALSTRQSIAVSALALANQSQQSVLQLLQG